MSAEKETVSLLRVESGFYDVHWSAPSASPQDTLPLGNGDVAANVRVDENGALRVLLSKSDAWSGNGRLLKLGSVKITLQPSLLPGRTFRTTLHVSNATILVQNADVRILLWIDALANVVHVTAVCGTSRASADGDDMGGRRGEEQAGAAAAAAAAAAGEGAGAGRTQKLEHDGCEVHVEAELWRTQDRDFSLPGEQASAHGSTCKQHQHAGGVRADSVAEPHADVVWFHRNTHSIIPELLHHEGLSDEEGGAAIEDRLLNRTFGCLLRGYSCKRGGGASRSGGGEWEECGEGAEGATELMNKVSPLGFKSVRSLGHRIAIVVHSGVTVSAHEWLRQIESNAVVHLGAREEKEKEKEISKRALVRSQERHNLWLLLPQYSPLCCVAN